MSNPVIIGDCTLYCGDSNYLLSELDSKEIIIFDPPFNIWSEVKIPKAKSIVAFTNWQNRQSITKQIGEPRIEMIWHFQDGRWVSPNMPRLTHESILIYGETANASVGEKNNNIGKKIKKGKGSIGKDVFENRVYVPKQRKQLNSVLCYPRAVSSDLGVWSKPLPLMSNIIEFMPDGLLIDPFMGSGTTGVACAMMGRKFIGVELNQKHFDIACQRIEKTYQQPDLFVEQREPEQKVMEILEE